MAYTGILRARYMLSPVRLSVRHTGRVDKDQSKTIEVSIM